MKKTSVLSTALALAVAAALIQSADAATLYWGGGTTDIANDTAIPTLPGGTLVSGGTGTWDTTIKNWTTSPTTPNSYSAWNNAGNDTAVLSVSGTTVTNYPITLGASVTVGGLTFTNNNGGGDYYINAGSAQTLTLGGSSPTIDIVAPTTSNITINQAGTNVDLAGTSGFTKTGGGFFYLSLAKAHSISGTANIYAGKVQLDSGQLLNISTFNVRGNQSIVQLASLNLNRIADSATINLSNGGTFGFSGAGGAANTETVGTVDFTNTSASIAANTAANSGKLAIGTFNRGTRGTVLITNLWDADANINITGTQPTNDVTLPWAVGQSDKGGAGSAQGSNTARFTKYDSATNRFQNVASTVAVQDLSTWDTEGWTSSTDIHYEWTTTTPFTSALEADLSIQTLAINGTAIGQGLNVLNLGGKTLTLKGFAMACSKYSVNPVWAQAASVARKFFWRG